MKITKFKKEDIEAVFKEKNIQFPVNEFIQALTQKEIDRQKAYEDELAAEAAKPDVVEIYSYNIMAAPDESKGETLDALLEKAIKDNRSGYFDMFRGDYDEGMPDEGEDGEDYFKIGDKFYLVELHCDAEWYGEWSLRKNLPGEIHITAVKEIKEYNAIDKDDYIILEIPKK